MESDEFEELEAKKNYLTEWLQRNQAAQEIAPHVHSLLETTEWEVEALHDLPEEADEILFPELAVNLKRDYDHLRAALPMIPKFDENLLFDSIVVNTSGSAIVYVFASRVGDLGTPQAIEYSQKHTRRYLDLQSSQNRPQEVRALLEKLNSPQVVARFDRARTGYDAIKTGTGTRSAAAAEMRTFLDGIKGELFKLAQRSPKENMTWEAMTTRLSKVGAAEQQELMDQGAKRERLISRLSDVLKDREGGSLTNLDNLWTQLLDHVYVVLGLIKIETN